MAGGSARVLRLYRVWPRVAAAVVLVLGGGAAAVVGWFLLAPASWALVVVALLAGLLWVIAGMLPVLRVDDDGVAVRNRWRVGRIGRPSPVTVETRNWRILLPARSSDPLAPDGPG